LCGVINSRLLLTFFEPDFFAPDFLLLLFFELEAFVPDDFFADDFLAEDFLAGMLLFRFAAPVRMSPPERGSVKDELQGVSRSNTHRLRTMVSER
jgi:hypothetical protein